MDKPKQDKNEKTKRLVIDGNAFYELDIKCMEERAQKGKSGKKPLQQPKRQRR